MIGLLEHSFYPIYFLPSHAQTAFYNPPAVGIVEAFDGHQPGGSKKAAERIVDIVRKEGLAKGKEAPPRLPLGRDGLAQLKNKCEATLKILEEWEELIVSTDLDEPETV
ncbi:hypothetical protein ACMFMF_002378 [Clarireedia jacksonii]